jgi:hypothetical protein
VLAQIKSDEKGLYVLDVSNEGEKVTLLGEQYRKRYIEPAKAYLFKIEKDRLVMADIKTMFPGAAGGS